MWCRIDVYDCTEMDEMTNIPGIKWLCGKCEPVFDKTFLAKAGPAAFFEGFKDEKKSNKAN